MECYRGYLVTVGESLGGFLMQVEFLKLEPQVEDSWRETGSKGCSDIWEGQLDMKDVTITTLDISFGRKFDCGRRQSLMMGWGQNSLRSKKML